ncbi:DVU0772 family protein [Desulforamulus ruminis]|uniref:Uncharacterized protein n=2 Tax=Desulforamulus ruminis TaxID=1564 RepID=F6DKP6_DESRL|nr:hypothetical protein [Desulforamulus ruminis]AEG60421.1 hypothetical protein Desru_2171 [Desulforamulus ruminis DSM 2154]
MVIPIIKPLIEWDYDFNNEFKNRERGYTFVIDVWECKPKLALYKFTPFGVKCDHLDQQPPEEMLQSALREQTENAQDGIYKISPELRSWIEKNVLQEES